MSQSASLVWPKAEVPRKGISHANEFSCSDRPCRRLALSPFDVGTRSGGSYVSWKLAQLARALPFQLLRLRQPPFRILVRLLVLPWLSLPVSRMVAHLHRWRRHAVAGSRGLAAPETLWRNGADQPCQTAFLVLTYNSDDLKADDERNEVDAKTAPACPKSQGCWDWARIEHEC
jgi:hypothetical protein